MRVTDRDYLSHRRASRVAGKSSLPYLSHSEPALGGSPTRPLAYRLMSERVLSRIGAASGVVSFVVTFVGFGVHGGLPSATTAAAIKSYIGGVSAGQTGLGNYLELLGYLLFLAFAAYL